jgi:hypothetical protein
MLNPFGLFVNSTPPVVELIVAVVVLNNMKVGTFAEVAIVFVELVAAAASVVAASSAMAIMARYALTGPLLVNSETTY